MIAGERSLGGRCSLMRKDIRLEHGYRVPQPSNLSSWVYSSIARIALDNALLCFETKLTDDHLRGRTSRRDLCHPDNT